MSKFDEGLLKPYLDKLELDDEELQAVKRLLVLNGDFSKTTDFWLKHGVLDSITVNLLLKKATQEQVKLILSGSIPVAPEQRVQIVFLVLKSYRKLVKELFAFIKSGDQYLKQKLAEDVLFEDDYLTYLVKLLKNDLDFVSALISTHKQNLEHVSILVHAEEPEVLFRVANLTNFLKEDLGYVKVLLHNPFTPDESVVLLKQLIHDIQVELESKEKEEEAKKAIEEIENDIEDEQKESDQKDIELLNKKEDEITKEVEENLYARVLQMNMPEKMKLAMKGNKSARMLLLKDPNKQISLAALGNPRITESEVSFILKNRSTGEHIIRQVARDRNWMKEYHIVKDVTAHPKTPLEVSMKLLNRLYVSDLGMLAKSRDIPANLRTMAARMFEVKSKKK